MMTTTMMMMEWILHLPEKHPEGSSLRKVQPWTISHPECTAITWNSDECCLSYSCSDWMEIFENGWICLALRGKGIQSMNVTCPFSLEINLDESKWRVSNKFSTLLIWSESLKLKNWRTDSWVSLIFENVCPYQCQKIFSHMKCKRSFI